MSLLPLSRPGEGLGARLRAVGAQRRALERLRRAAGRGPGHAPERAGRPHGAQPAADAPAGTVPGAADGCPHPARRDPRRRRLRREPRPRGARPPAHPAHRQPPRPGAGFPAPARRGPLHRRARPRRRPREPDLREKPARSPCPALDPRRLGDRTGGAPRGKPRRRSPGQHPQFALRGDGPRRGERHPDPGLRGAVRLGHRLRPRAAARRLLPAGRGKNLPRPALRAVRAHPRRRVPPGRRGAPGLLLPVAGRARRVLHRRGALGARLLPALADLLHPDQQRLFRARACTRS